MAFGADKTAENLDITDIQVGDYRSLRRTMSDTLIRSFAELTGDWSPLHVDDEYARQSRFGQRVVHGLFLSSHFSTIVGMMLPGKRALLQSVAFDYLVPVFIGDDIEFSASVEAVRIKDRKIQLSALVLRGFEVCARGNIVVEVRSL